MKSTSSQLVCISDDNQFAGLKLEEVSYDDVKYRALPLLQENFEMSGLFGAHPVVASPRSVAVNHLLCGLGSQQPWQKDHGGFMENDAHHVQAQISSFYSGSLESHQLLELEVTICGVTTTFLIDSGSTHNFIDKRVLNKLGLWAIMGETLEVVLEYSSKPTIDNMYLAPI